MLIPPPTFAQAIQTVPDLPGTPILEFLVLVQPMFGAAIALICGLIFWRMAYSAGKQWSGFAIVAGVVAAAGIFAAGTLIETDREAVKHQ
ncbi:MAG: hypothetical protein AAGB34_05260, partial [Planctomycetota bacterium]